MKERGLGTPATRAAVIEGLLYDKYIVREGKELVPTAKGADLMRLLSAIGIEELVSPELTGEWEFKLNRIERGLYTRPEFMKETVDLARKIVVKIKAYDEEKDRKEASFISPIDGQKMYETLTRFESEDGALMVRKVLGGRQMSEAEIIDCRGSAARWASRSMRRSRSMKRTRWSSSSTTIPSVPTANPWT
jgi:DNA topoisomerase III